jgi:hypothetical protein
MTMIFDHGASWCSGIKLEEVLPSANTKRPKVIAKHGKPPAQYEWD